MSRLPEFMSQVKCFGSSVILIILRLSSFPEFTLIFLQVALLKGLGHAILGNNSTDQMLIELTKISK